MPPLTNDPAARAAGETTEPQLAPEPEPRQRNLIDFVWGAVATALAVVYTMVLAPCAALVSIARLSPSGHTDQPALGLADHSHQRHQGGNRGTRAPRRSAHLRPGLQSSELLRRLRDLWLDARGAAVRGQTGTGEDTDPRFGDAPFGPHHDRPRARRTGNPQGDQDSAGGLFDSAFSPRARASATTACIRSTTARRGWLSRLGKSACRWRSAERRVSFRVAR